MAEWVEPHEWTVNELITAAKLNTYRAALLYLKEIVGGGVGPIGPFTLGVGSYLGGNLEVLEVASTSQAPYTGVLVKREADAVMVVLGPEVAVVATNKPTLSLIPGLDLNTGERSVGMDLVRDFTRPEFSGVFLRDQAGTEIAHLCPDFHRFGVGSPPRYVRFQVDRLFPEINNYFKLGDPGLRWADIYTQHIETPRLKLQTSGYGWTLTGETDGIYALDHSTGKKYRVVLEEVV